MVSRIRHLSATEATDTLVPPEYIEYLELGSRILVSIFAELVGGILVPPEFIEYDKLSDVAET